MVGFWGKKYWCWHFWLSLCLYVSVLVFFVKYVTSCWCICTWLCICLFSLWNIWQTADVCSKILLGFALVSPCLELSPQDSSQRKMSLKSSVFIGSRYTRAYVCHTPFWNWCDETGWWRYQLNTNWWCQWGNPRQCDSASSATWRQDL